MRFEFANSFMFFFNYFIIVTCMFILFRLGSSVKSECRREEEKYPTKRKYVSLWDRRWNFIYLFYIFIFCRHVLTIFTQENR